MYRNILFDGASEEIGTLPIEGTAGAAGDGVATQSVVIGQTATGTLTAAGSASQAVTISQTATGEGPASVEGEATQSVVIAQTASGTLTDTGSASQSVAVSQSAAGSPGIVGSVAQAVVVSQIAAAVAGVTGEATQAVVIAFAGTGTTTATGVAAQTVTISQTATGEAAGGEVETPARGGGLPWVESEKTRKRREARTRAEREREEELRRQLRRVYRKVHGLAVDDERAEPVVEAAKAAVSAPLPEVATKVETFAAELARLAEVRTAVNLMREVLRIRQQIEALEAAERAALEDEEDAMVMIAMAA